MAIANVALTDTFDYWRTVTNSLVVAINDKLIYCNTLNSNTVSITSFASRTSNLTVNILTSSAVNDVASGNVASALAVNTAYTGAISFAAASNTWANTVGSSANSYGVSLGAASNTWANTVGTAGNNWLNINVTAANNWSNSINSFAVTTFSPKVSPTFTGTITINGNIANQTLTDGATISWDVSLGSVATVTLGGNRTVAAPTNLKIGTYVLHVIQDGSGSRTLTWNSVFKWPAGVAPTLTTTANRRDLFSFVCDGTNLYGSYLPDVR